MTDLIITKESNDITSKEANRCLKCNKPMCINGCPIGINIPGFIAKIVDQQYQDAYNIISASTLHPAICGRVCPKESQCEALCRSNKKLEAVGIGRLERWIGDMAIENGWITAHKNPANGLNIGIIGSGPAGLACAGDMKKAGCDVTIFEALDKTGGILRSAIPESQLPPSILDAEINKLLTLGVRIECNVIVGQQFTIEQMLEELGFDAVFVSTGLGYQSNFKTTLKLAADGNIEVNEALQTSIRCVFAAGNVANDAASVIIAMGVGKKAAIGMKKFLSISEKAEPFALN